MSGACPGSRLLPDTSLGARIALWGVREAGFLIFASLVAGFATMPYAAYHFHRLAPYGVLANLLAMPVISALSMPAGLLALLAMPFGLDGPLWRLMGVGIDWMIGVATWVASLPGAVGHIHAFGIGALVIATAGLLVLCLLRSPLRLAGVVLIAVGCIAALTAPQPDVLVSATGEVVAVRGADGRLSVLKSGGNDALSVGDWLNSDGDARSAKDQGLAQGFACDPDGCVGHLADGAVVAVPRGPAAFADDCARAALIVTMRPPPACAAMVIDRKALRETGALALTRRNGAFEVTAARPGDARPAMGAARGAARGAAYAERAAGGGRRDAAGGCRCGGVTCSAPRHSTRSDAISDPTDDGSPKRRENHAAQQAQHDDRDVFAANHSAPPQFGGLVICGGFGVKFARRILTELFQTVSIRERAPFPKYLRGGLHADHELLSELAKRLGQSRELGGVARIENAANLLLVLAQTPRQLGLADA